MKMFSKFSLRSLAVNDSGNVAILFGLFSIPLSRMGLAVDSARALHARTELQSVVDSAAIAGARLPATANQIAIEAARHFSATNLSETGLDGVSTEINANNAEVKVAAEYRIRPLSWALWVSTASRCTSWLPPARRSRMAEWHACLALNPKPMMACTSRDQQVVVGQLLGVGQFEQSHRHQCGRCRAGDSPGLLHGGRGLGAEHFAPAPFIGCEAIADPFQDVRLVPPLVRPCDHKNVSSRAEATRFLLVSIAAIWS